MYCTRNVFDDLVWVGADDRRLSMFEGVYSVPDGISYNSYLLLDDKTVLFDAVDKACSKVFFENVAHALAGRSLDYLVVHHMEPDHSATIAELVLRYPQVKIVCNDKTAVMLKNFFDFDVDSRAQIVKEGESLKTGSHELSFYMAPMVHWPEVMVSYDKASKTLFSADAFGCFGALGGALFADEVDFERDYMDEARRYYVNICGKYGAQVMALLKKAASLDIEYICPLHGFVWRRNLGDFISKYALWASYTPEENGVLIAYASIYGNTENAAEILACRLRERGIKTAVYDVSVTPSSYIVAAAFRYSHLVLASPTYNAGIFVTMEDMLRDLAAHNIQNRTVALIQNGSWAPASGKLMSELLGPLKNMHTLEESVDIRSSLKETQLGDIERLADAIAASLPSRGPKPFDNENPIDPSAFFKLSYGLFVLTARDADKDNGCIINTPSQLTSDPARITIAVNKANYTHDMVLKTGLFNISVLSEQAPFKVFKHFGFQSGRDVNKFEGCESEARAQNGLLYVPKFTNAFFSCKVISSEDYGSHTLFIGEVTEARALSGAPAMTYAYYHAHVKPKPLPENKPKSDEPRKITGWRCKICGYV